MPFSDWCISILCYRTPLNFFIVRSIQPKRFCHFEFLSWGVFLQQMYLLFFPLPFESFGNLKQWIVNIFEAVFWELLDFGFWKTCLRADYYCHYGDCHGMDFLRIAFIHGIWLLDLAFTRLLDSVKYESGTFIADFVSSFVIKGALDGIYLRNNAGLCVGTLCKASCEEFVFGDQGLCKWILLASNSGTLYSFCEWLM